MNYSMIEIGSLHILPLRFLKEILIREIKRTCCKKVIDTVSYSISGPGIHAQKASGCLVDYALLAMLPANPDSSLTADSVAILMNVENPILVQKTQLAAIRLGHLSVPVPRAFMAQGLGLKAAPILMNVSLSNTTVSKIQHAIMLKGIFTADARVDT